MEDQLIEEVLTDGGLCTVTIDYSAQEASLELKDAGKITMSAYHDENGDAIEHGVLIEISSVDPSTNGVFLTFNEISMLFHKFNECESAVKIPKGFLKP